MRRRRHKIKERNWVEEESKFRGRISRWSISRRLIIQSGRAGGMFSWRLLPPVASEHLYRIVGRSSDLGRQNVQSYLAAWFLTSEWSSTAADISECRLKRDHHHKRWACLHVRGHPGVSPLVTACTETTDICAHHASTFLKSVQSKAWCGAFKCQHRLTEILRTFSGTGRLLSDPLNVEWIQRRYTAVEGELNWIEDIAKSDLCRT